MNFKQLRLKPGKEKFIQRKHPWIFSGAFALDHQNPGSGELVNVVDNKGNHLATGFWHSGSIAVKVLTFSEIEDPEELISSHIKAALEYREKNGLFELPETNCCRLVFAEGDHLPGLIIDKYDRTAVIQIHHKGWVPFLQLLSSTLMESGRIDHVYCKSAEKGEGKEEGKWLTQPANSNVVKEYGHSFYIDWAGGQKTGFFLDQRESRRQLGSMCREKRVLNTFSYTGGFSVYALAAGATEVVSVDISKPAVELAQKNAELNGFTDRHKSIADDVFSYLQKDSENFDIIVLDPPAFSKSRRTTHNAVQGYKRLNRLAMEKIKKGGILFSFSCSQHIPPRLFEDTLRAAAIEANRSVRIIGKLNQPSDHPVNIYHPEGEYLKGLIMHIN